MFKRAVMAVCAAVLLCVAIYAADVIAATEFYGVQQETNDVAAKVTLTFQQTDKSPIEEADPETRDNTSGCYFRAVRGTLTYDAAQSGQRYVVLITAGELADGVGIATDSAIVFIREVKADDSGSVTVNFYPAAMEHGQRYYVYLSGSAIGESAGYRKLIATFQYKDYLLGDPDGDRQITARDSLKAMQIGAETRSYVDWEFVTSDVDGDGVVKALDALAISQKAAGLKEFTYSGQS